MKEMKRSKRRRRERLGNRMALVGNRGQEPPNHMGLPLLGVLPEYAGGTERQVVQAMSGHSIFDLQ